VAIPNQIAAIPNVAVAREKMDAEEAIFVDIRDGESRRDGHIAGSGV
jgi:rhodanese-related sulfurtransferase